MKIRPWLACASILVFTNGLAQGQASVQGSASANAQGTASADRQGANAATSATGTGSASARAADKNVSAAVASGSELNATLTKPLDARKNKPGDEVVATVAQDVKSNGQVVIPRGSKLIGHVTEAKASAAADASSRLGVVFDRAVLKNGREVPLDATIHALAAAKADSSEFVSPNAPRRPDGRGVLGGVSSTAGGTLSGASSIGDGATGTVGTTLRGATHASAGAVGGLTTSGTLSSGSRGVFGMNGLDLQSAAPSSAHGSVITSTTRNVRLEAGTQMLLTTSASTTR
jgi:hypothetical protein